jgi:signal transduction histidine kinase
MTKIPFTVSARTARLIGRENVSNAEGAITELVKNAYDADASICIVYFDNKYLNIPESLTGKEFDELKEMEASIESSYESTESHRYQLVKDIPPIQRTKLQEVFKRKCSLFIIDNGEGMTGEVIKKYWMTIGTDLKEHEVYSKKKRVRVGAKGIGRFSLDRLGERGEMVTLSEGSQKGIHWKVNWGDFEKKGAVINEVTAALDEIELLNYPTRVSKDVNNTKIQKIILDEKNNFQHGTLLKISLLRDEWSERMIDRIFNSLEILNPPEGQRDFKIYIFNTLVPDKYGPIDTSSFSDYDYKLKTTFLNDDKKTVEFEVHRAEFDFDLVDKDVFKREEMQIFPFDKKTFREEQFKFRESLFNLMPGIKQTHKGNIIDKIGKFDFYFYFLKNQIPNPEDRDRYFYKEFKVTERAKWLSRFGGIRMFKDGFRIRPYGEPNTSSHDWLRLGERQAKDPAGVARKGAYRVRPNQVAGTINISRLSNLELIEKSSREGIQENESLEFFKNILIAIIKKFEDDRSTVAFNLDQLYKEKYKEAEAREKAEKMLEEEEKRETLGYKKTDEELEKKYNTYREGFKAQKKELEEKDYELKLSRALASAGLMIASFAHEFKGIKQKLNTRTFYLKKYLKEYIKEGELLSAPDFKNPFKMIDDFKKVDNKIQQWMDFSLGLIRKDRRRTRYVKLSAYLKNFKELWNSLLKERHVDLKIISDLPDEEDIKLRIFEVDLDTIFDNLLINSVEAFQRPGFSGERVIEIDLVEAEGGILISYHDNGPGLSKDIKNSNDIFKPFFTTKKDEFGNDVGTGLGMWLLKSTVDEYKGKIDILKSRDGFNLDILFYKK